MDRLASSSVVPSRQVYAGRDITVRAFIVTSSSIRQVEDAASARLRRDPSATMTDTDGCTVSRARVFSSERRIYRENGPIAAK